MKKNRKSDPFVREVSKRFDDFEVPAPKNVWTRIEEELDAEDESVKRLNPEEQEQIIRFLKYGSAS